MKRLHLTISTALMPVKGHAMFATTQHSTEYMNKVNLSSFSLKQESFVFFMNF